MARKAFSELSPTYRERLLRAGERRGLSASDVRRLHVAGDLRELRGHRTTPRTAAPREVTDRAALGLDTTADKAALDRWRRSGAPEWIPKNRAAIGDDTAAVLSQLDIPPERWKEVRFVVLTDGRVQMIVTPKRGYDRVIFLPDRDSMTDVARLIRDPVPKGASKADRKRLERQWGSVKIRVNAAGTQTPRRAVPADGPLVTPERPRKPSSSTAGVPVPEKAARPAKRSSTASSGSRTRSAGGSKKATKKKKAAARKAPAKRTSSTRTGRAAIPVPSTPDVLGLVEDILNATPEQLDQVLRILRGE